VTFDLVATATTFVLPDSTTMSHGGTLHYHHRRPILRRHWPSIEPTTHWAMADSSFPPAETQHMATAKKSTPGKQAPAKKAPGRPALSSKAPSAKTAAPATKPSATAKTRTPRKSGVWQYIKKNPLQDPVKK
jgi:hypothetical protein